MTGNIFLINDPKTLNAWCMPGGKIAFYSWNIRGNKR
jgi:hypothetical protein